MEIHIQLTTERITEHLPPPMEAMLGAWVEFRGVVRGEENGATIVALEYEAYRPMAEREIHRRLNELSTAQPCLAARVIHRLGIVPVGEGGDLCRHRRTASCGSLCLAHGFHGPVETRRADLETASHRGHDTEP